MTHKGHAEFSHFMHSKKVEDEIEASLSEPLNPESFLEVESSIEEELVEVGVMEGWRERNEE